MFGSRRASQKPDDEFITKFRKAFPHVVSTTSLPMDTSEAAVLGPAALESLHSPTSPSTMHRDAFDADDTAPGAMQDLRFTWPFMDPNSFDYPMPLANQTHGYCAPPQLGGMDNMFHGQSGNLQPLPIGLGMTTAVPLSSHIVAPHHSHSSSCSSGSSRRSSSAMGLDHFNPQYFPGQFQDFSFGQQGSYAPSTFVHHDSGYGSVDNRMGERSPHDVDMQLNPPYHVNTTAPMDSASRLESQLENNEKFRYNVTLRAPTAMIKHPKEIPVTYLNKGQTYTLSVVDSNPPPVGTNLVRYRTYVRVSFEEEEQRSKVAACWQLWKEGRGLNEAHQRGGKLLAVECADPIQVADDSQNDRQVQLESASFDGFCVTWTADLTTGVSYCAISVRFNFLSTDFSHSKGVKGVPVRLCAKTQMISPEEGVDGSTGHEAEVSYCKVKLFRDHGAERKLSNDVAHVKKAIEKLKQQIAQAELGAGSFGKRKRGSMSAARPAKFLKHSRSWSIDPQNADGEKLSVEDDLHTRLVMMQDMFSSTRPVSVLSLRGDEQDDPDLFPVQLSTDLHEPIVKVHTLRHQRTTESLNSIDAPPSMVTLSPTNSTVSLSSPRHTSFVRSDSGYHSSRDPSASGSEKRLLDHPVKVPKLQTGLGGMPMGCIEAIDVDPTYQPPAERLPRPVACFYARFDRDGCQQSDSYYRTVYLNERTVDDLTKKISEKQEMDLGQIVRVVHISRNGLKVMVDDDMIRELTDGQDMIVEFRHVSPSTMGDAVEVLLKY